VFIPRKLAAMGSGFEAIGEGATNAEITRFEMDGARYFLKSVGMEYAGRANSAIHEAEVLHWLRERLNVPRVLGRGREAAREFFVMEELAGRHISAFAGEPELFARILAQAVLALRAVDVAECPFDAGVATRLAERAQSMADGMADIDTEDWEADNPFADPVELYKWLMANIPDFEPTFTHGDLPSNIFVDGDNISFYDIGRGGVGDKWADIALCVRDIRRIDINKIYENLFFDLIDEKPDYKKLKYFILLDELF